MDDAQLVEALKHAHALVEEAGLDPDAPSGVAAFTEALRRLAPVPSTTGVSESAIETNPPSERSSEETPADLLASWLGIDRALVEDVIEFRAEEAEIQVRTSDLPRGKLARQRLLALLKLTADRIAYSKQEVSFRDLNALCDRYACLDQNLPSNVTNFANYISRRGARGAYTYRLTQQGLEAGRDEMSRLVHGPRA